MSIAAIVVTIVIILACRREDGSIKVGILCGALLFTIILSILVDAL